MKWQLSKSNLLILGFGLLLGILLMIMNFIKFKFLIGNLSTEIYTLIVAVFFTLIGIFLAGQLVKRKQTKEKIEKIRPTPKASAPELRSREYEILQLIAKGHTNQEIANQLHIALPTVKTHVSNLYSKLDVKNRTQAILKAQEHAII